jgi:hypothetical protein
MNGKRRLLGSFNHGSMANALPQAIGAQLAFPGCRMVTLSGDGGISMLLGDLLSLRQLKLPVKIVVFNNGALGFVDLSSVNPACRREYYWLRRNAPKFGFGKVVHSLPIKGTEEGVARYVSKYISKHMAQRLIEDKGARLCSYWGTARKNRECCSLKFSWAGIGGWLSRTKLASLSKLNGFKDRDGWADRFGPRWAYQFRRFIKVFPLAYWPTGMHAIRDGFQVPSGVDASTVIDLRSNRKTEIRGSTLHGTSIY